MPVPDTDLLDPTWWQTDPQAEFAELRAFDGLWRDERSGFWLVGRHADVLQVERDATTFASRSDNGGAYRVNPSPGEMTMISQDDPEHLAQRRIVNRRFTPRAVRDHGEHYTEIVNKLVDGAIAEQVARGSVEVIDALAAQLPCRVTADLLGFGQDRWRQVKDWSERQMRIDHAPTEPAIFESFLSSIGEWAAVMQDVLPQRLAQPEDDLFSDWLAAEVDGSTMVMETGLVIAGGAETTRTVIAHGLRTLVDRPDVWEQLATEPSLVPAAVEELIRWVTPLNNMFRIATVDAEIAGTRVAAGDRIALVYPAANRDPEVFDRPDEFDITRDPNPHLSFGHGTHFCLGANVARIELRLLFEALTQRVTNLRAITEPDVEPNIFARAVRSFELGFETRS
jgi:cytochrome P450 family 142 subfamily A polypeptide 1